MKIIIFGLAIAFTGSACENATEEQDAVEDQTEMQDMNEHENPGMEMDDARANDKTGPEYTSKYICPMHCEGSGSDEPGVCPVCGMEYILNENFDHPDSSHNDHNDHMDHQH